MPEIDYHIIEWLESNQKKEDRPFLQIPLEEYYYHPNDDDDKKEENRGVIVIDFGLEDDS